MWSSRVRHTNWQPERHVESGVPANSHRSGLRLPRLRDAATVYWIGVCVALICAGCAAEAQTSPHASARRSQVIDDFGARVTNYLELRRDKAGTPPGPTNSPEKVTNSEQEMGAKVRAARPNAKQGDIFTPKIANYFRHQIAASLSGRQGERIRASLRHAEPVDGISIEVNKTYPAGVPLQSTPPSLLLKLPRLPKELEYRIVGHDLVLHDIAANLIVDYVPNAIPTS